LFRRLVGYDSLLLTHDRTIVTESVTRVCAESGTNLGQNLRRLCYSDEA